MQVDPDLHLSPQMESLFFRIAQEAMRNITAHADASHVRMRMGRGPTVAVLEIADDGRGFSPAQAGAAQTEGHLGLRLITDLVGDVGGASTLTSAPGEGTTIRVEIPFP
jgi:signal transduction histidine kinase